MHQSRIAAAGAVLLAAVTSVPAQASIFGTEHEDYLGISAFVFMPDSARNGSNGLGGSVHYGFSFSPSYALEGRGSGAMFEADDPNLDTQGQVGGGLDLVLTPGGSQWLVLAGAGMAETSDDNRKNPSSYVNAGLGWRTEKVPTRPLRFRFEARAVDHIGHDDQVDLWLGAGVEFMLSAAARQPAPAAATPPAPLQLSTVDTSGDADADGVADVADQCASTARTERVEADGCAWQDVTVSDLQFPSTSNQLAAGTRARLDEVVRIYGNRPDVKIAIHGHADGTHSEAYNLKLSKARAAAVYQYLVDKGLRAEQLSYEGFGEMRPIASNETESGKAANRRVELHIRARQPG